MIRAAIAGAALLTVAGCGVVYTAPGVHDGSPFGTAYGTDLEVRVVPLTHETAQAANLEPYVPPRLPAAFQPDTVASMAELGLTVPSLPPLPSPTARKLSRPDVRRGELPPPAEPGPYRIGAGDGLLLGLGESATAMRMPKAAPVPAPNARNGGPEIRRDELPPPTGDTSYQIGVGDVLLLAIREPATLEELPGLITAQARRQGYIVQDDGTIAIPEAGRVRVAGLDLMDAEAAIFEALVSAGIDPAFSLEISEFKSKHASIGGLVAAPQLIPISIQPVRLEDAITVAGGVATNDPGGVLIQLFREGTIYQFSFERYLADADARDIILRDGDSIFIGTDFREPPVQDRQLYRVQNDGTIAIPGAGRVRVADLTVQEAQAEIFDALVAARLQPEFSLEISEFTSKRVSVGGLVATPQLVPITLQPLRLDEAIQAAGGLADADPSVTTIQIFRDGTVYQISLDRFLGDPTARQLRLQDGDSVFVGSEYREAEAQRYFEEQLRLREEAVRSVDYEIQIEQLREQRASRVHQQLTDERERFRTGSSSAPSSARWPTARARCAGRGASRCPLTERPASPTRCSTRRVSTSRPATTVRSTCCAGPPTASSSAA